MKLFKLNNEELSYIKSRNFFSEELMLAIKSAKIVDNYHVLNISEESALKIRDLFGEQLQYEGFDTDYELTNEGRILEDLIDKFWFIAQMSTSPRGRVPMT